MLYLAKFLAQQGVCSRRKAALLVKEGLVAINNHITCSPAHLITESDIITFNNQMFQATAKIIPYYMLFNKPAKLVTTTNDEFKRESVIDYLRKKGITQHLFPIGRLDYLTTGLLLLTNDGDFAYRMSHPKFEVIKQYRATLSSPFKMQDFNLLKKGLMLSDGFIKPDELSLFTQNDFGKPSALSLFNQKKYNIVEISIHSGRNRIVRRIFEALGYEILELKRTAVGQFSLGNIPVGHWKFVNKESLTKALK